MCALLIDYCQRLLPKTKDTAETIVHEKKDIAAELSKGDFKKEKITLLNKQEEDLFNVAGAKAKKGKKKGKKEEVKPETQSLNHKFDVLGFFENMKVAPPMVVSKLEGTIKVLQEKKEYFESQTEKVVEKKEETEKRAPPKQKKLDFQEAEFPSI